MGGGVLEAGPAFATPPGPARAGRARAALVKEQCGGGRGAHCSGARRSGTRVSLCWGLNSLSCLRPGDLGRPLRPFGVRPPPAGVSRVRAVPCAQWANLAEQLCPWSGAGVRSTAHAELQIQTAVSRGCRAGRPEAAGARRSFL
jgi:hypothetical protein